MKIENGVLVVDDLKILLAANVHDLRNHLQNKEAEKETVTNFADKFYELWTSQSMNNLSQIDKLEFIKNSDENIEGYPIIKCLKACGISENNYGDFEIIFFIQKEVVEFNEIIQKVILEKLANELKIPSKAKIKKMTELQNRRDELMNCNDKEFVENELKQINENLKKFLPELENIQKMVDAEKLLTNYVSSLKNNEKKSMKP